MCAYTVPLVKTLSGDFDPYWQQTIRGAASIKQTSLGRKYLKYTE